MNNKVGILGGTFNPIHIGHILMCSYSYDALELDKVYLLPNENPPHKRDVDILDGNKRLEMCKIIANENDFIEVLDFELNKNKIFYTIDTIIELKKSILKNKEIYFLIGADSLMAIESWKNYKELLNEVKFICLKRPDVKNENLINKVKFINEEYNNSVTLVDMPLIDISSSNIRSRVNKNYSIKYMVDENVLKYIDKNNLYKG